MNWAGLECTTNFYSNKIGIDYISFCWLMHRTSTNYKSGFFHRNVSLPLSLPLTNVGWNVKFKIVNPLAHPHTDIFIDKFYVAATDTFNESNGILFVIFSWMLFPNKYAEPFGWPQFHCTVSVDYLFVFVLRFEHPFCIAKRGKYINFEMQVLQWF